MWPQHDKENTRLMFITSASYWTVKNNKNFSHFKLICPCKMKDQLYLLGVPSSCGCMTTTVTGVEVRRYSIICSWVRVPTATLQISNKRQPGRSPACQANPNGSTSATTPSKLTWKPSWPRAFLRRVISSASQPLVTIYREDRTDTQTLNIWNWAFCHLSDIWR